MADDGHNNNTRTLDNNNLSKSEHIKELLSIIHGENTDPPLGQPFSFNYGSKQMYDRATKLAVTNESEWDALLQHSIVWASIHHLVQRRECIQIGPLYLSKRVLPKSDFQQVCAIRQWKCNPVVHVLIACNQGESEQPNTSNKNTDNKNLRESTLKGLMKISAVIRYGSFAWELPKIDPSKEMPWILTRDWGVILDKVHLKWPIGVDSNLAAMKWIARHFRTVNFNYSSAVTESMLHDLLVDAESNVQHLEAFRVNEQQIGWMSEAMQHSTRIKSLDINVEGYDSYAQIQAFIRVLCNCQSLTKIHLGHRHYISRQELADDLISLIRCGHFDDISYFPLVGGEDEFPKLSKEEQQRMSAAWTQSILDVIHDSPHLLNLSHSRGGFRSRNVEREPYAMLEKRRDASLIVKMLDLMEENKGPIKMALLGKMAHRFVDCKEESERGKSVSMLFDLLCRTSDHLVGQQLRTRKRANKRKHAESLAGNADGSDIQIGM